MAFAKGRGFVILNSMAEDGNPDAQRLLKNLKSMPQDEFDAEFTQLLGSSKGGGSAKGSPKGDAKKGDAPEKAAKGEPAPKGKTAAAPKQTKSALEGIEPVESQPKQAQVDDAPVSDEYKSYFEAFKQQGNPDTIARSMAFLTAHKDEYSARVEEIMETEGVDSSEAEDIAEGEITMGELNKFFKQEQTPKTKAAKGEPAAAQNDAIKEQMIAQEKYAASLPKEAQEAFRNKYSMDTLDNEKKRTQERLDRPYGINEVTDELTYDFDKLVAKGDRTPQEVIEQLKKDYSNDPDRLEIVNNIEKGQLAMEGSKKRDAEFQAEQEVNKQVGNLVDKYKKQGQSVIDAVNSAYNEELQKTNGKGNELTKALQTTYSDLIKPAATDEATTRDNVKFTKDLVNDTSYGLSFSPVVKNRLNEILDKVTFPNGASAETMVNYLQDEKDRLRISLQDPKNQSPATTELLESLDELISNVRENDTPAGQAVEQAIPSRPISPQVSKEQQTDKFYDDTSGNNWDGIEEAAKQKIIKDFSSSTETDFNNFITSYLDGVDENDPAFNDYDSVIAEYLDKNNMREMNSKKSKLSFGDEEQETPQATRDATTQKSNKDAYDQPEVTDPSTVSDIRDELRTEFDNRVNEIAEADADMDLDDARQAAEDEIASGEYKGWSGVREKVKQLYGKDIGGAERPTDIKFQANTPNKPISPVIGDFNNLEEVRSFVQTEAESNPVVNAYYDEFQDFYAEEDTNLANFASFLEKLETDEENTPERIQEIKDIRSNIDKQTKAAETRLGTAAAEQGTDIYDFARENSNNQTISTYVSEFETYANDGEFTLPKFKEYLEMMSQDQDAPKSQRDDYAEKAALVEAELEFKQSKTVPVDEVRFAVNYLIGNNPDIKQELNTILSFMRDSAKNRSIETANEWFLKNGGEFIDRYSGDPEDRQKMRRAIEELKKELQIK
jgi:hypothetical protein